MLGDWPPAGAGPSLYARLAVESDASDETSLAGLESESLHELRRGYHDRIAELRSMAQAIVVDAAVALSRTVRAYERLTDHAVEIADRVLFAVNGSPPGLSLDALGS
jgi:phosphate uptake regulator